MKIRTGRRNRHALYLQTGDAPTDNDRFMGSTTVPEFGIILAQMATHVIEQTDPKIAQYFTLRLNGRSEHEARDIVFPDEIVYPVGGDDG